MQLRGFTPVRRQVGLVGAMRLRSARTNRSAYCLCQGLDSKLKNLDWSSLLVFSIFLWLIGLERADLFPISVYIIFSRGVLCHIVFSPVGARLEFSSLEVK